MSTLSRRFDLGTPGANRPCSLISIINPLNGRRVDDIPAVWDTGSTCSIVVISLLESLGVQPHGNMPNVHGGGEHNADLYRVKFCLENRIDVNESIEVMGWNRIDGMCGALIGMDIIKLGDFSITSAEQRVCISFRYPSLHEIDYMKYPDFVISTNP